MVVAAEIGTDGGQVAVLTKQMLKATTHRPTIKVWKQKREGFNFKTRQLNLILGIWSAILGNITKHL